MLAGLVALVVTTVLVVTNNEPTSSTPQHLPVAPGSGKTPDVPTVPVDVPGWREGEPITDETLAALPPEEFFYTVYKRHSMIRVQELIQEPRVAATGKPLEAGLITPVIRTLRIAFDYGSKEFAKAETARYNGELDGASICVDGKEYVKTTTDLEEGRPYHPSVLPHNGAKYCPRALNDEAYSQNPIIATWLNDAFMTGGLTADQSDGFIALMRKRKLISVGRVAKVEAAGKRYVAVEGEVNRVEDPTPGATSRLGTNVLLDAFDRGTGLDGRRHPYPAIVGTHQGLKWVLYLDERTLRPAFSKRQTTPVLDRDGKISVENENYNESVSWVRWRYPTAVPKFTVADGEPPLSVDWPQGLPGR